MYDWLHLFLDNMMGGGMGNMGGGRSGGNMGYGGGYGGYGNNMGGNNMGGGPQNNNFSGYTSFGNENVSYPGNYNNMRWKISTTLNFLQNKVHSKVIVWFSERTRSKDEVKEVASSSSAERKHYFKHLV